MRVRHELSERREHGKKGNVFKILGRFTDLGKVTVDVHIWAAPCTALQLVTEQDVITSPLNGQS